MKVPSRRVKESAHVGDALLVIAISILLIGLLFPSVPHCGPSKEKVRAQNDVLGLVTALKYYRTEYGQFPFLKHAEVSDEVTQGQLIKVLQGSDDILNPRKVVFFEAKSATKRIFRQYNGGISPHSNALLDPWGNPYRLRFVVGDEQVGKSPYQDDSEARPPVIVWSLGKDGVQGSPGKENILEGSDDIVSWR